MSTVTARGRLLTPLLLVLLGGGVDKTTARAHLQLAQLQNASSSSHTAFHEHNASSALSRHRRCDSHSECGSNQFCHDGWVYDSCERCGGSYGSGGSCPSRGSSYSDDDNEDESTALDGTVAQIAFWILAACLSCCSAAAWGFCAADEDSDDEDESMVMRLGLLWFKTFNLVLDWGFALSATDCGGDCDGMVDAAMAFAIIGSILYCFDMFGVSQRFGEDGGMPPFSYCMMLGVLGLQDFPMFVLNCHFSVTTGDAGFITVTALITSAVSLISTACTACIKAEDVGESSYV